MGWFGNGEVFECLDIVAPYAGLYGLNGSVLGLFDKISLEFYEFSVTTFIISRETHSTHVCISNLRSPTC